MLEIKSMVSHIIGNPFTIELYPQPILQNREWRWPLHLAVREFFMTTANWGWGSFWKQKMAVAVLEEKFVGLNIFVVKDREDSIWTLRTKMPKGYEKE